jgi:peptidoglycan/LPS O-acetylase OafA/YrhL
VFRLVGAIIVVLVHYELIFGQFIVYGALGTTALSWFFIVSGFVLSYVYPSIDSWQDLRRFYTLRLVRIYPAYAMALTLATVFVINGYQNLGEGFFVEAHRPVQLTYDLPEQKDTAFWIVTTIRHYLFTQSISAIETLKLIFNGPLWSLVLEVYFYVTFPLFLLLLRPVRTVTQIFALFIALYFLQFLLIEWFLPDAEYYDLATLNVPVYTNPLIRFVEFVFGILVYKLFALANSDPGKKSLSVWPLVVSILVYLAVIYIGENYVPYQYSSFFIAVPFVAVLVYCQLHLHWYPGERMTRFCELLGGLSYIVYCFHWPFMEIIQYYDLLPPSWPYPLHLAVLTTLLLIFSYTVYHLAETPLRRGMRRLLYR